MNKSNVIYSNMSKLKTNDSSHDNALMTEYANIVTNFFQISIDDWVIREQRKKFDRLSRREAWYFIFARQVIVYHE